MRSLPAPLPLPKPRVKKLILRVILGVVLSLIILPRSSAIAAVSPVYDVIDACVADMRWQRESKHPSLSN